MRTAIGAAALLLFVAGCSPAATNEPAPTEGPAENTERDEPAPTTGSGESPESLAEWACAELRRGRPEREMTPELGSRIDEAGVDAFETLTLVERQCPELLS
jgi:hypothetical protein